MKDTITAGNLFIWNGLAQSQLTLDKSLFVYFVDFFHAFDLVSWSILFYKILNLVGQQSNRHPPKYVLKNKIPSEAQRNAKFADTQPQTYVIFAVVYCFVNICWIWASTWLVNCNLYYWNLDWAFILTDDLISFSDSTTGLQRQINGLVESCSFS